MGRASCGSRRFPRRSKKSISNPLDLTPAHGGGWGCWVALSKRSNAVLTESRFTPWLGSVGLPQNMVSDAPANYTSELRQPS